jgi:hypothetical protein
MADEPVATSEPLGSVSRPWAGTPVKTGVLPRTVSNLYKSYAYDDYVDAPGYAYDTAEDWKRVTSRVCDRLSPSLRQLAVSDPTLYETETGHFKKMQVCWRLTGKGRLLHEQAYVVKNAEQAKALRPYLARIGMRYAGWIRQQGQRRIRLLASEARVVLNRGKGAPWWLPSTDPHGAVDLANVVLGSSSSKEMKERLGDVAPIPAGIIISTYSRIQAQSIDKPVPRIVLEGDRLVQRGTMLGPKVRDVKASSYAVNIFFVVVAWIMRYATKETTRMHEGTIDYAVELSKENKYGIAADLSTYDNTVSSETITLYREVVLAPVLRALVAYNVMTATEAKMVLELDEVAQVISILAPPRTKEEEACLIDTDGIIKSGERLTSQKGTDINEARVRAKADLLGLRVGFCNQSDDLVIFSNDPRLEKLWGEDGDLWGFKETAVRDVTYLMRRIPQGYNYLTRMIASCINREWRTEPQTTLSAASAIRIRRELIKGHPLEKEFYPVLKAGGGRLQLATELAEKSNDAIKLAMAAASEARKLQKSTVEAVLPADTIERLLSAGYSKTAVAELSAALSHMHGRSEVTVTELKAQMKTRTKRLSVSELKRRVYTTRVIR